MTATQVPDEGTPLASKQDPEALVLRARPQRVVRFRRGLIIGTAALVSAGLVAVTWLALEPPTFRSVAAEERGESRGRPAPEALANAPSSYGDVPRLGPPLPGDLARPILEHQRSAEAAGEPVGSDPALVEAERARAAAEAERQRLYSAREAARASGVIVQLSGGADRGDRVPAEQPPAAPTDGPAPPPGPLPQGGRSRKVEFARSSPGEANSHSLAEAPSPWTLAAGTIIPASLVTGLNSDLPGMVLAQVTEPVRDTATGRTVLVPQGSRLLGSYDSVVAFGQRRALLVWQRIVFPDGTSVRLDNAPAVDAGGYAGVEDRVNFHTWRLLKGIALSSLLGVGTELGLGSGESDLVRAVREATQQNVARAGDQITQRNLDVQPTLTVRPGWPVRAVLHKDLILRPWRG